jgi:hypothetical protein
MEKMTSFPDACCGVDFSKQTEHMVAEKKADGGTTRVLA